MYHPQTDNDALGVVECTEGPVTVRVFRGAIVSVSCGARSRPYGSSRLLRAALRALERYFDGEPVAFDFPLDYGNASAFDRAVWRACAAIPRGEVRSYAEVAQWAGHPQAARATGQALGRNPLPVLIPCHRVLRADGGLGGFGCGLKWKKFLLRCEGVTL